MVPKGKQKIVPTYGKHHGVKLLGVLDYETSDVFCTEVEQNNAQVFLSFLQTLAAQHPKEKMVMVLDNARISAGV